MNQQKNTRMNHMYTMRRIAVSASLLLTALWTFPATFTVTNTNDSGAGSLRQAIIDANATPGADVIVFNIPGSGPFVITPGSGGLPSLDEQVTIDGYSQPTSVAGSIPARVIQIVISGASAGNASGITVNANNVTVAGLAIHSFQQNGINIVNGVDNTFIWGNFIGSDQAGFTDLGNGNHGINLGDGGPGGNDGVIIGTNSDGANDAAEGNLISGNGQDGILGWALTNAVISGNFIGSDRTGAGTTLGNGRNGIILTVSSNNNRIGTNGDGVNDVQELNGIILNIGRGIFIAANSNANVVAGNIIGLNTLGNAAGNLTHGIEIVNSSNNRVGIDATHTNYAAERNVISSNAGNGIFIVSQNFFFTFNNANGNVIAGNYIGTTPTNQSRGNSLSGIVLDATEASLTTEDNVIGSNNDGVGDNDEGNIIAYNNIIGIGTTNSLFVSGNKFSRNSTYSNANLGIDLQGNGVSANDDTDADNGPNELFNFPVVVRSNKVLGTTLMVRGITRPSSIVEVYLEDGSGEGRTFLFRAQEGSASDNATGDSTYSDPTYGTFTDRLFEFNVPLNTLPNIPAGSRVVALAIKAAANDSSTSEFGPSLAVLPVSLSSFQGNLLDGTVKLSWSTSREINSSHFVIEKSFDGSSFKSIGQVKSGSASQYAFTDNTPLGKVNYYRLKQVDLDGNFAYSRVILIRNDGDNIVMKLAPNPIAAYLNISVKLDRDEALKVHLYDQSGRQVKRYNFQGNKGLNAFNLNDLNSLPAGNYTVEVLGETVKARQQIVKK